MAFKGLLGAGVASLMMLTVAGCGDDSAEPKAATTNEALTGDPIKVGMIGSFTGPLAASTATMRDGIEVWEKYVNANNGVNGHPVDVVIEDDKADPSLALQKAKKLVEEDGVVAIVGHGSLEDGAWAKYTADKGIPVIGGLTVSNSILTNPNFFPSGPSSPVMVVGEFAYMAENDFKNFGVLYCAEDPLCASLEGLSQLSAGLTGGKTTVNAAQVSATAPNYQSQCLAMKDKNVDALMIASASTVVTRVAEQCGKLGYDPTPINQATVFAPDWLTNPALDGAVLISPTANFFDESIPGVNTFSDAVDDYAPTLRENPQFAYNTVTVFAGGQLFAAAAEAGDIDSTSTPEDVMAAMYQLKEETLDGLTVPLTFTEGQPTMVPCWFTNQVKDGKIATVGDGPTCLSDEQVAGLGQALAKLAG